MEEMIDDDTKKFETGATGTTAEPDPTPGYPGPMLTKHKGEKKEDLDKNRSVVGKIRYYIHNQEGG